MMDRRLIGIQQALRRSLGVSCQSIDLPQASARRPANQFYAGIHSGGPRVCEGVLLWLINLHADADRSSCLRWPYSYHTSLLRTAMAGLAS